MLGSLQTWGGTILGCKNSPKRRVSISVNTGTERNDLFMKIQQAFMPRFVVFSLRCKACALGVTSAQLGAEGERGDVGRTTFPYWSSVECTVRFNSVSSGIATPERYSVFPVCK